MAKDKLTIAEHKRQIAAYEKEKPHYETYAKVMHRVLYNATCTAFPEVLVQSREKSISSFAEKCARRFDDYPDPVNQLTDLCGARVILQTQEQVDAVSAFIRANFIKHEEDNKCVSLGDNTFGYRDLHFIVELKPTACQALGISRTEQKEIGNRKAEVQVRTWLQHAWADTLHDRIYKNPLELSAQVRRTGARLAALMEEGDGVFNEMAHEIDGLIANYTAYASKKDVTNEIAIQKLILRNTKDRKKKPALALKLARLVAATGDHQGVVKLLRTHRKIKTALCAPLLLQLGASLCRVHRDKPKSKDYQEGIAYLEQARDDCLGETVLYADNLRKHDGLCARILNRLAWALEPIGDRSPEARACYRQAHRYEPRNPYYLSDMLEFEACCSTDLETLADVMQTTLHEAIKSCREHAEAGIELPFAYFTAGRLSLLLGGDDAVKALGYYARGIQYCVSGQYCVPDDVIAHEIELIERDWFGKKMPQPLRDATHLLQLGQQVWGKEATPKPQRKLDDPVLIISGGAASLEQATRDVIEPMLRGGLSVFRGTVTSGGTTSGIPGLVGDLTQALDAAGQLDYKLVGYRPTNLPDDSSPHPAYQNPVTLGDTYSPQQVIRNWQDILRSGVDPAKVLLLGFGGGPISAIEYRIALGFGASVAVVPSTGGAAKAIVNDPLWQLPHLYPIPLDGATFKAFLVEAKARFDDKTLNAMGREFHQRYVKDSSSKLPPTLKPWDKLADTYRTANIEQARYAVEILEACGFGIRKAQGKPVVFDDFTEAEIEQMAELEHGRWNVERLRNGWRYHPERDDDAKRHPCLIPWTDKRLDSVRKYDKDAMKALPHILHNIGYEVYRK